MKTPEHSPPDDSPPSTPAPPSRRPRRLRRLGTLGVAVALAVGGSTAALLRADEDDAPPPAPPAVAPKSFHSAPDLDPDTLTVKTPARRGVAPGYLFLAVKRGPGQDGPMIADDAGQPVWFHPVPEGKTATAFKVQRYRGRPVLTWWEGNTHLGHGHGEYVVMDERYREIARIRTVARELGDHHEFQLTEEGTALVPLYLERRADLSAVGGRRDDEIIESRIQEIDVETGRLLWEWRSADHVPVTEGMTPPKPTKPHDYFHINSIEVDDDGNLIVSARNTHAIYKIERPSGRIIWRLGGRRSDFRMLPGARFAFQHDARRQRDGTITLFDNQATPAQADRSRGLVLRLDTRTMTARRVREYVHPEGLLAGAECNLQVLPNGNVVISWGPKERVSEFSRDGRLLLDIAVPEGADTYQAFRFPWRGRPTAPPDVAASRDGAGVTAWASWNGATEVRAWRLLAGDRPDRLEPVGEPVRRTGFETTLHARTDAHYVAVEALDGDGRPLRASSAVRPSER